MSLALTIADEPLPGTIPLSAHEKRLKAELESIIEHGLEEFLRVGAALTELRNRRLYRVTHASFSDYVRDRFGLARSTVDGVIRSAQTAEALLEAGVDLSRATEASIRPLNVFQDPDLQKSCWKLAEIFSPDRTPTSRLVARLCHVVRQCLENPDSIDDESSSTGREGFFRGPRPPGHQLPFSRPVARLAGWSGFSATIIVAGIQDSTSASNLYRSCGVLAERCRQVQAALRTNYPELLAHA